MTWFFDPAGQTVDVYDHEGKLIADSRSFDGVWSEHPDIVATVVAEEAREAINTADLPYATAATADLATGNIEEGTPPGN